MVSGVTPGPAYGASVPWSLNGPQPPLTQPMPAGTYYPAVVGPQGLVGNWQTNQSASQDVYNFSAGSSTVPDGTMLTIFGNDGGKTNLRNGGGGNDQIFTLSGKTLTVQDGECYLFVRQTVGGVPSWYQVDPFAALASLDVSHERDGSWNGHKAQLTANANQKIEYPRGTVTAVGGTVTLTVEYTCITLSYTAETGIWSLISSV